jgi:PLP dependent protein
MGVSKTFPAERIREAYAAGLRVFGENRVQEFAGKADALRDLRDIEWHLIGHLQTNKAAKAAELFDAVDSVDSVRMAEKLNALAESAGKITIRPGRDQCRWRAGKKRSCTGLRRTGADSARRAAMGKSENSRPDDRPAVHRRSGGLATLFSSTPSASRFAIAARKLPQIGTAVLSMGMSHDFEVAIEEGATWVRVGTAIFGERAKT